MKAPVCHAVSVSSGAAVPWPNGHSHDQPVLIGATPHKLALHADEWDQNSFEMGRQTLLPGLLASKVAATTGLLCKTTRCYSRRSFTQLLT